MYGDPLPNLQIKSTNIFVMLIWGPTAKFNSCQYFRLYGKYICVIMELLHDGMLEVQTSALKYARCPS